MAKAEDWLPDCVNVFRIELDKVVNDFSEELKYRPEWTAINYCKKALYIRCSQEFKRMRAKRRVQCIFCLLVLAAAIGFAAYAFRAG